jgi:hypothetical protein
VGRHRPDDGFSRRWGSSPAGRVTTRIHQESGIPLQEVAEWPWTKRLWYAEAYDAIEPDQSELGAGGLGGFEGLDVDAGDVPGDIPSSFGSTGKSVTKGVSKHDNVLSVN